MPPHRRQGSRTTFDGKKSCSFRSSKPSRASSGSCRSGVDLILISWIQDSTLIQTISGNIFSKDATDWRWWHPSVPTALKKLHADKCVIGIAHRSFLYQRMADEGGNIAILSLFLRIKAAWAFKPIQRLSRATNGASHFSKQKLVPYSTSLISLLRYSPLLVEISIASHELECGMKCLKNSI